MIRPPPRPPLFPYTTLFRSGVGLSRHYTRKTAGRIRHEPSFGPQGGPEMADLSLRGVARRSLRGNPARSEEHTSELQSHVNLVCRLLLEKKNKNKKSSPTSH